MKIISALIVLASVFVGCASPESHSGSGGGSTSSTGSDSRFGRSPAIESFQAGRRAALADQAAIDALDAQTASAAMVDISPDVEAKRVQYVLDWTVDDLEMAIAETAGVAFVAGAAPRSQGDAEAASKDFELEVSEALYALPEQKWDHEWAGYASDSLDAQVAVSRPEEWEHIVYTSARGTCKAAKIVAIKAGAESMQEADAALTALRAQIADGEDAAFDNLAAMTVK